MTTKPLINTTLRCYQCEHTLTDREVIRGAVVLREVNYNMDDFEGWAHCMGKSDQFFDKNRDQAVIEKINAICEETDGDLHGVIVVCSHCALGAALNLGRNYLKERD